MIKYIIPLIVIIFSSSCANIMTGLRENLIVTSNPPGAKIYTYGQYRGVTPLKLRVFKRDPNPVSIVFIKEGYKVEEVIAKKRFNFVYLLSLPGFPFVPLMDYPLRYKKKYSIDLEKGESTFLTKNNVDLSSIESDYIVKNTGEVIPCIITNASPVKIEYIGKNKELTEVKTNHLTRIKVGQGLFELVPKPKNKKKFLKDWIYTFREVEIDGQIKLYGSLMRLYVSSDEVGKRTIKHYFYTSKMGKVIVKLKDEYFYVEPESIIKIAQFLQKSISFREVNSGAEITMSNYEEKIKLYNKVCL